jgi:hypothetical protein
MNNELKPCPFCGGKAETSNKYSTHTYDQGPTGRAETCGNWITSYGCKACGIEKYSVAAWNRRADEQVREAVLRHAIQQLESEAAGDVSDDTPGNECCGLYGDGLRRAVEVLRTLSPTPAEPGTSKVSG